MEQKSVTFEADGLNIEGVISRPDKPGSAAPGVVVCHPHPLHGGNMDNNVVLALSFVLADQGFTTLRFNFRGVGNSQGQHANGELERQEVLGALEFLGAWPGVDAGKIGLAGYSFGSSVILRNPELHDKAKAFALVSPPLGALETTGLMANECPVFVIAGDQDKVTQSGKLGPLLKSFAQPPSLYIAPGVDHFWFGREEEMAPRVAQFFAEALK